MLEKKIEKARKKGQSVYFKNGLYKHPTVFLVPKTAVTELDQQDYLLPPQYNLVPDTKELVKGIVDLANSMNTQEGFLFTQPTICSHGNAGGDFSSESEGGDGHDHGGHGHGGHGHH